MFLWRAALDILPHYAELCRRKIRPSPFCDHWNLVEKTTLHVLFGCRGLDRVWVAPPFSISLANERDLFWARLIHLKTKLDEETFLVATIVLWKTWENRNSEVHDSLLAAPNNIVQSSVDFYEQFR